MLVRLDSITRVRCEERILENKIEGLKGRTGEDGQQNDPSDPYLPCSYENWAIGLLINVADELVEISWIGLDLEGFEVNDEADKSDGR